MLGDRVMDLFAWMGSEDYFWYFNYINVFWSEGGLNHHPHPYSYDGVGPQKENADNRRVSGIF